MRDGTSYQASFSLLPQVNIIRAKHGDFLAFFESAGISGVLTAHGVWDELSIAIAKGLLDIQENIGLVLDIGANMGTFSVPLAKHILPKSGLVHAFEPQRIIYYQLCGNVFLNRLQNVFTHNVALSNMSTTQHIEILDYDSAWNIGAYSLLPEHDTQKKQSVKQECEFLKLDDARFNPVSLIKIDVEGMEVDVLQGAEDTIISSGYPPIMFESLPGDDNRQAKLRSFLQTRGYHLVKYADADWVAQHPQFNSEIQFNFTKEGALSSISRLR
jgi:FkbM family methyltransferase